MTSNHPGQIAGEGQCPKEIHSAVCCKCFNINIRTLTDEKYISIQISHKIQDIIVKISIYVCLYVNY